MSGFKEGSIPNLHLLPSHQQAFIRGCIDECGYDHPASKYVPLLLEPRKILPTLMESVRLISMRSVRPENATHPEVVTAWNLVRDLVEDNQADLAREEAVMYVYGSMQFDDPRGLDFDIDLVTKNHKPHVQRWSWELTDQLRTVWPTEGKHDGHINYVSIQGVAEASQRSLRGESIDQFDWDKLSMANASVILTGRTVFDPAVPGHRYTRNFQFNREIDQFVRQNPLFGVILNQELATALEDRQERAEWLAQAGK